MRHRLLGLDLGRHLRLRVGGLVGLVVAEAAVADQVDQHVVPELLAKREREADRAGLLQQLAALRPHPESVPINMLVRVEGTPLAKMPALDPLEMVRAIATARILMPASRVRLAAGRKQLSQEAVTLCFLAGANSIFVGEKLLTTPNPGRDEDEELLQTLGMKPLEPHAV